MALKSRVVNITARPIQLPAPYNWLLQSGAGVAIGDTPEVVAANLGDLIGTSLEITSLDASHPSDIEGALYADELRRPREPNGAEWAIQGQDHWSVTNGQLNVARRFMDAVALKSGKAIVCGGTTGNGSVATDTVELYNPATDVWTLVASMPAGAEPSGARTRHATIELADGRVLVAGGNGRLGLNSSGNLANMRSDCAIYDPVTNSWAAAASLPAPMFYPVTGCPPILLKDGRVILTGGVRGDDPLNAGGPPFFASKRTFIYNPVTDAWATAPDMVTPRVFHASTRLRDGKVFVTGGGQRVTSFTSIQTVNETAEIYDPVANTWAPAASMPSIPEEDGSVPAGYAMINVGGRMDINRSPQLLPDNRVLIAGGSGLMRNGASNLQVRRSSTILYDPVTDAWERVDDTPYTNNNAFHFTQRGANGIFSLNGLYNNDVFVENVGDAGGDCWLFDPATLNWYPVTVMRPALYTNGWPVSPYGYYGIGVCMLSSGKVLMVGGSDVLQPDNDGTNLHSGPSTARLVRGVGGYWGGGYVRVSGLTGMSAADESFRCLVISGAASAGNNGAFSIARVLSATEVDIYNPNAVLEDLNDGLLAWHVEDTNFGTFLPHTLSMRYTPGFPATNEITQIANPG